MSLQTRPKIVANDGETFQVSQDLFDAIKDFAKERGVNGKIEIFYKDGGMCSVEATIQRRYRLPKAVSHS